MARQICSVPADSLKHQTAVLAHKPVSGFTTSNGWVRCHPE